MDARRNVAIKLANRLKKPLIVMSQYKQQILWLYTVKVAFCFAFGVTVVYETELQFTYFLSEEILSDQGNTSGFTCISLMVCFDPSK